MLNVFRKAAHTWVAKILFVLLILSFAIWGIGDMVRVGISNAPAIVAGKVEVPAEAVVDEYKRELTRLQRVFGSQFTEEQARTMGLMQRTVDNMVARALIDQAADDLDMLAPDEVVRQAITANPAFHNQFGRFDNQVFRNTIAQAGFSEQGFLQMARKDVLRGQLIAAVSDGVTAPAVAAQRLFAWREEKRVADTVTIEAARIPAPPPPGDDELKAYWQANESRFMAPEYRAITALLLRPVDVAGEVAVTDAMIEDAYHQRAAEFHEPERRNLRQALFASQDEAAKAAAALKQTPDFAQAVQQAGQQVLELGWMDAATLETISPELARAAFAAPDGGVTEPVQSPLGWHLVQVAAVQPGKSRALPEVRDQITQDIIRDKSVDLLYELANKVEDTLASGARLEEAAQKLGLRTVKAEAIDRQGKDPQGQPAAELPAAPAFLTAAFQAAEGSETRMQELGDNQGFFMLRVDKVIPPAVRPFDTIRDDVAKAWQAERQLAAARAKADEAAQQLRAGKPAAEVAAATGGTAGTTPPFTRQPAQGAGVAPELAAQVFTLPPAGVAVVPTAGGAVAARLQQVIPADPQKDAAAYAALRQRMGEAVAGDLVDQFVAALHATHSVRVNQSVINERLR